MPSPWQLRQGLEELRQRVQELEAAGHVVQEEAAAAGDLQQQHLQQEQQQQQQLVKGAVAQLQQQVAVLGAAVQEQQVWQQSSSSGAGELQLKEVLQEVRMLQAGAAVLPQQLASALVAAKAHAEELFQSLRTHMVAAEAAMRARMAHGEHNEQLHLQQQQQLEARVHALEHVVQEHLPPPQLQQQQQQLAARLQVLEMRVAEQREHQEQRQLEQQQEQQKLQMLAPQQEQPPQEKLHLQLLVQLEARLLALEAQASQQQQNLHLHDHHPHRLHLPDQVEARLQALESHTSETAAACGQAMAVVAEEQRSTTRLFKEVNERQISLKERFCILASELEAVTTAVEAGAAAAAGSRPFTPDGGAKNSVSSSGCGWLARSPELLPSIPVLSQDLLLPDPATVRECSNGRSASTSSASSLPEVQLPNELQLVPAQPEAAARLPAPLLPPPSGTPALPALLRSDDEDDVRERGLTVEV